MNKRIKELVEQAGFTVEDGHIQTLANKQIKKLIELIIFECANAVMDGTKEGDWYAQKIEEHFDRSPGGILHYGVEE